MMTFTFERSVSLAGLCLSIAAFGVSIYSSIETGLSANRTADIALKGQKRAEQEFSLRLFADLRPWVSIKPIVKSISLSYNTMRFANIDFEIENHGRSAAVDIVIDEEAAASDFSKIEKDCRDRDAKMEPYIHLGTQTLLPAEKIIDPRVVSIRDNTYYGRFVVTGCVTYRTTVDEVSHQTRFSYSINPQRNADDKSSYQSINNFVVEPETFSSFLTAD